MKITEIRTYKMQVPLVRPFRIALGLITHAVSCLVEIETDAGIKHALPGTTPKERLTLAEAWRPFRSYATVSLWR